MTGPAAGVEAAAAHWLARRDGPDWSEADESGLQAWLDADVRHRVAVLRLRSAWDEAGRLEALAAGLPRGEAPVRGLWPGDAPRDAARAPLDRQLEELVFAPRRPAAPRRRERIAAAAIAMLGCALALGWLGDAPGHTEPLPQATALGEVRSLALADGSQASLGSDTRMVVRLSRRERNVALEHGEAYFEAARDPARPFVVEAGARRVVAVGTRFSVRRDADELRVVVTEGLVRLEAPGDAAPTLLPAGSVAMVGRDGVLVRTLPLEDASRLLDWRGGLLVFRDTPLAEAAREFNRYSARRIVVADPRVGALRIGGSFRWANAEGFVRLLEQGFPVRADYQDQQIVLHAR